MDICAGLDMNMGMPAAYYPGGDLCDGIIKSQLEFTSGNPWFTLVDIDPLNEGFNPYPVARLDTAVTGGIGLFADSDGTFDDGFYTGPIRSVMVTIYSGEMGMSPEYINYGDGDASRMVPSNSALVGVDITEDFQGNLYGLWADPEGILPPEVYGLMPDYTRHDVIMGGDFPPELLGDGPGMISPDADNLKAFEMGGLGIEIGYLYILESDGGTAELEVIEYTIDGISIQTNFTPITTIPIDDPNVVDIDSIMFNPMYLPNPESDSIAVLINGGTGAYIQMYNSLEYNMVEEIGKEDGPVISGTATALDSDNVSWALLVTNDSGQVSTLRWVFE
jgi:hypothetical protein